MMMMILIQCGGRSIQLLYSSKSCNTNMKILHPSKSIEKFSFMVTLLCIYTIIIIIDALMCKQHLNVVAGYDGGNFNYLIYC